MTLRGYLILKINNLAIGCSFFLFFICTYSALYSCDIKNITRAHSAYLSQQKLLENSLLSITKNEISIITNGDVKNNLGATGTTKVNIYQSSFDKLVLKEIFLTDFNSTLLKLFDDLKHYEFDDFIVSKEGIFVFVNKRNIDNSPPCYDILFYKKKASTDFYQHFSKTNNPIFKSPPFEKNVIVYGFLNSEYKLSNLQNDLVLTLDTNTHYSDLSEKIHELRKINQLPKNIIIKPERAGLQIIEIQIPISAYDRAHKFKDENELFYATNFKVSKSPNLVKSSKYYSFDLALNGNQSNLSIDSKVSLTDSVHSDIGFQFTESELNLSKLNLGFRKFNKNNSLNSYKLGKFSSKNAGFLYNTQTLNKNEQLIDLAAYINLQTNCKNCIKNGLYIGFEQYNSKLDGYMRANLLFQNLKNKSHTIFEILIKKKLSPSRQVVVSTQFDMDSKVADLSLRLVFPLSSNQKIGTVSYMNKKTELISNWTATNSSALLENTPGFFKRNWKNYINFNQP